MERTVLSIVEWRVHVTTSYTILLSIFYCLKPSDGQVQFLVASQLLVLTQKDLNLVDRSPIVNGFAAAVATFCHFNMKNRARSTLMIAEMAGIEQDLIQSVILELEPFLKNIKDIIAF